MKRSPTKGRGKTKKTAIISDSALFDMTLGTIARLRIYRSSGTVIAYKAPGHNADAVGDADDPNIIRALFWRETMGVQLRAIQTAAATSDGLTTDGAGAGGLLEDADHEPRKHCHRQMSDDRTRTFNWRRNGCNI
jgi:hypothetical protein